MVGFAEQAQGSTDINWGRSAGRAAAGLGVAGGVVLAGVGLMDPEFAQEIGEAFINSTDQATEAANKAPDIAKSHIDVLWSQSANGPVDKLEAYGTISKAASGAWELGENFVGGAKDMAFDAVRWAANSDAKEVIEGIKSGKEAAFTTAEAVQELEIGSDLVQDARNSFTAFSSEVAEKVSSEHIDKFVDNLRIAHLNELDSIASSASDLKLNEATYEAIKDQVNDFDWKGYADALKTGEVQEFIAEHLKEVSMSPEELAARSNTKIATAATGLSAAALGAYYLSTHPAQESQSHDPIADAQAQTQAMGFAQKEEMRKVGALMEARAALINGQQQAPQGPALG